MFRESTSPEAAGNEGTASPFSTVHRLLNMLRKRHHQT